MASLTVLEGSEPPETPILQDDSPPAGDTAAHSIPEAFDNTEDSTAEDLGEREAAQTPQKSPLQGSQILNTPNPQNPGTARKGNIQEIQMLAWLQNYHKVTCLESLHNFTSNSRSGSSLQFATILFTSSTL